MQRKLLVAIVLVIGTGGTASAQNYGPYWAMARNRVATTRRRTTAVRCMAMAAASTMAPTVTLAVCRRAVTVGAETAAALSARRA